MFATEVLTHPVLLAVCDAFLLPGRARYQLNLAHVIDRGPGAERQWPHRDEDSEARRCPGPRAVWWLRS
ncbi:hypothetical protein AB0I22_13680 [Streptomyces sp. NPDC050610]|uniref:hypothetical protein n=1 Tax=Streptomyces sp. NPDC050610 TaxID=3157097 RepID=UPI003436F7BB